MKVIWTKESLETLDLIYEYISKDSTNPAEKVIFQIINTANSTIKNFPHIGRTGRIFGTREYVISEYLYVIIYAVKNGTVYIIRIMHSSMKYP